MSGQLITCEFTTVEVVWIVPPAVRRSALPPVVPMVSELTLLVSKVMFLRFRPASIASGEWGADRLNIAISLFVVPAVAPGTGPDQLLGVAQPVSVTPVQKL